MGVLLSPCPFCEGPPCPIVQNASAERGAAPVLTDYGNDGLYVCAFVFCHECGAQGPEVDALIFDQADYEEVEGHAVEAWQTRDAQNRRLYVAGNYDGLNLYPRRDHHKPTSEGGRDE